MGCDSRYYQRGSVFDGGCEVAVSKEQIAPDSQDRTRKSRKFRKESRNRADRHKAKQDPAAAPKKRRYWGYEL